MSHFLYTTYSTLQVHTGAALIRGNERCKVKGLHAQSLAYVLYGCPPWNRVLDIFREAFLNRNPVPQTAADVLLREALSPQETCSKQRWLTVRSTEETARAVEVKTRLIIRGLFLSMALSVVECLGVNSHI